MFRDQEADCPPTRRCPAATPRCRCPTGTPCSAPRCRALAAGLEVAYFGMGCFWGAERIFWQLPGVYSTAVGYQGGYHPEPDVRGDLLRPDRAHRGRPGGLRPGQGVLRGPAEGVLGEPRPDPGHAPGQRRRHAVPLGDLHHDRRAAGRGRRVPGGVRTRSCGPPGTARSPPRSPRPGRSTTPRTTTSSTCPTKNPGGYCNHGPNGMTCPVGVARVSEYRVPDTR